MVPRLYRSGSSSVGAPDRIQFQMTLHEEDEENVDEKDQVRIDQRLSLHSVWFIWDII